MLHKELTKANTLIEEGNYNKALHLLESFEENENLTLHDLISYNLLRSSLLNKVGSYNDAFKHAEQAYQKSQEVSKNLQSPLPSQGICLPLSSRTISIGFAEAPR